MPATDRTHLREGIRRIRAHQGADRLTKARWYLLEPIGWARCRWETRRSRWPWRSG